MKIRPVRIAPRIWTRLFILITAITLSTWVVVGIAFYWLDTSRNVVENLGQHQVPRLMNTAELSAKTTDLAIFSNKILYSREVDPEVLESALRKSVIELDDLLSINFDTQVTRQDIELLKDRLSAVIYSLNRTDRIEEQLRMSLEQLRWLNVDTQDETAALVADYSYNIRSLTQNLTHQTDVEKREQITQKLLEEQAFHSQIIGLGNETAIAITLAIQILTSQSEARFRQLESLLSDALGDINIRIDNLPRKPEFLSLRQSVKALNELTVGPRSAVTKQKIWYENRIALNVHLRKALAQLSVMRSKLKTQAAENRTQFDAVSAEYFKKSSYTLRLLVLMTVLAATVGLAVLFLYIRPAIIRPMRILTSAMYQIVDGKIPELAGIPNRGDEISRLVDAVNVFHSSVQERDQAIDQLRRAQSELVQAGKMAALGTLSAGISHELNQPLGAIRQRMHMVDKALAKEDHSSLRHQVQKIDELVDRMERIIVHLRRFARQSEYTREVVKLIPLVTAASELLAAKMTAGAVKLECADGLDDLLFVGDPILIEQVLVNLLSNSIDAIAETGSAGKIVIEPEVSNKPDMVSFSIVDAGKGLGSLSPQEAIDPFVSTKEPGQGLGLGLSIAYNIVTGMGGSLQLSRRNEKGTRATITLPSP